MKSFFGFGLGWVVGWVATEAPTGSGGAAARASATSTGGGAISRGGGLRVNGRCGRTIGDGSSEGRMPREVSSL